MKKYVGHLLIANPSNPEDELSKAVMICLTHTSNLGIALQLNRIHTEMSLSAVSNNLGIKYYGLEPIWYGGNISVDKIHIVHSLDWRGLNTMSLTKSIGVTNDISILSAIVQGKGPQYFKACSGYWLFDNGRLDGHLSKTHDPSDPYKWETLTANLENVFHTDLNIMWEVCLQQAIIKKVKEYF
jgi:putative AlgH/UPF0301 family transcriptional regulator